jgi:hypothetical protein
MTRIQRQRALAHCRSNASEALPKNVDIGVHVNANPDNLDGSAGSSTAPTQIVD